MRGLIFHFFFIGINAVFSYILTGSLWLSALLFVVFGVISAFGFNYCRLMHLSAVFLISTMVICISFITIKHIIYIKDNNCSVNTESLGKETTIRRNEMPCTFNELEDKIKDESSYQFSPKSKR